jgi:hypothetical protein
MSIHYSVNQLTNPVICSLKLQTNLALFAQASCLDLILFMNLVDFSIALLAFASTFCKDVGLSPKRGLSQSSDGLLLLYL